jgi:hypothetical protein
MSASDIPPSIMKKKSTEAYVDQALVDMSGLIKSNVAANVPASILKRKGNVGGYIDTSRHYIEQIVNPEDMSVSTAITKHPKIPSAQAVAAVSKQKMISANIFRSNKVETVGDIATLPTNQDIATVSKNKSVSSKKKNPFGDVHIQDAQYKEMVDDVVESQKRFRTVEPKDAKNLGNKGRKSQGKLVDASRAPVDKWKEEATEFTNRRNENKSRERRLTNERNRLEKSLIDDYRRGGNSKGEPSDFAVISELKQKTKESLKRRPEKPVPTAADAFDYLVDTFIGKGKPGEVQTTSQKKRHSLKSHIVHGMKDVNEIFEEVGKNPNLIRLNQNAEADYSHMRSHAKRARESIAGTSNTGNKRTRTAGSLITLHNFGTTTTNNTVATSGATNQYGIVGKYEYGRTGKLELHYYYQGYRLTHEQASKILTAKQIHLIRQEAILGHNQGNTASTTPVQTNQSNNTGTLTKKPTIVITLKINTSQAV